MLNMTKRQSMLLSKQNKHLSHHVLQLCSGKSKTLSRSMRNFSSTPAYLPLAYLQRLLVATVVLLQGWQHFI